MAVKVFQFLAIMLTAISLVSGGAHVAEMPAKMRLEGGAYHTVQQLYAGWSYFGWALFAAIGAGGILTFLLRDHARSFYWSIGGTVAMAATLVTFFAFVFPVNQATENWTAMPDNWPALRQQWEYVHALNAALTFLALCAFVLAALSWKD